jgi:hypothetical protein
MIDNRAARAHPQDENSIEVQFDITTTSLCLQCCLDQDALEAGRKGLAVSQILHKLNDFGASDDLNSVRNQRDIKKFDGLTDANVLVTAMTSASWSFLLGGPMHHCGILFSKSRTLRGCRALAHRLALSTWTLRIHVVTRAAPRQAF